MIALGSDHGGFILKKEIVSYLEEIDAEYEDFGTYDETSTDYPIYAGKVSCAILDESFKKGILICGTGIGISIAANRIPGIRCALCHDVFSAKAAREHNDANILALGGRVIGAGLAREIVKAFLFTEFSNGERHARRIEMIESVVMSAQRSSFG